MELRKLEEMASYINESFIVIPEAQKKKATADKFSEIVRFLAG